jgi:DNA-binding transcriptional LysR family regulator
MYSHMGVIMQASDRIGRRIKLQDVHILMTVVQAGSMGKAARRLNTSQPNVSKSIADLERALGVRLLDRQRQGVEPTDYGRALLNGGAAVFDELRQTVKKIEFLADPEAGEVRIGANPALAAGFASVVIDRLSRRYPRMTFNLVSGVVEALLDQLQERSVDFLIARRFGPIDEQRVDFEVLFDTCASSLLARKARGLEGAASRWPNGSTNHGCCPHREAGSYRSKWKPFAPAGWTIPARPSSPTPTRLG